ncbi:MAG: hypothetical protein Hyperionvirus14_35 [Hyperionvirus sp.]|uniref:VWFA domain-containing protein n=1 Tax=Hyperionvirus sp. TaxID=2487770 RepID=A0A3G5A9J5_9VIRU|nr:MAG: hypothetical protein Hyperionvirus14_35 [Hyperionvirus sp.]
MGTNERFEKLVKQYELKVDVANQLDMVLSSCKVVLVCDDSGSMNNVIAEDLGAAKKSTRWLELKKLAAKLIEFVTAINAEGLDIYFLNRGKLPGVTSASGLQDVFAENPYGNTPLLRTLKEVYYENVSILGDRQLLIIVITDGLPSDCRKLELFYTLADMTSMGNVHVSFAECTDVEEDMAYLDEWDNKIKNFDNTDDYREELRRVRNCQGPNFKFDYTDYVIKILLATFVKWYFNLDQPQYQSVSGCCTIL